MVAEATTLKLLAIFFSSKYGRNEITLRFEETWQSVNNEAKFLIKLLFRNVQVFFTF